LFWIFSIYFHEIFWYWMIDIDREWWVDGNVRGRFLIFLYWIDNRHGLIVYMDWSWSWIDHVSCMDWLWTWIDRVHGLNVIHAWTWIYCVHGLILIMDWSCFMHRFIMDMDWSWFMRGHGFIVDMDWSWAWIDPDSCIDYHDVKFNLNLCFSTTWFFYYQLWDFITLVIF
jgi:hypothetical protein